MKKLKFLFILLLFVYSKRGFSQTTNIIKGLETGKSIYSTYCLSCHMENGEGIKGVFPPLAKSEYLNDKNKLVNIILRGLKGPIKVNNVDYSMEMVGLSLSDQEVADVINYIRNSWGNKSPLIKVKDIMPVKK